MNKFNSIKAVFTNLLYAFSDYKYLSSAENSMIKAAFLDQNQVLFSRLKYYLYRFIIIEILKITNHTENHSIVNFINEQIKDGVDDTLKSKLVELSRSLKPKRDIIEQARLLRIKHFAHLDSKRFEIEIEVPTMKEIEMLMDILYQSIQVLNQVIEKTDYEFPLTTKSLDYRLHEQYVRSISMRGK